MACEAQRLLLGRCSSHHPPPDAHADSHAYSDTHGHADSYTNTYPWQSFPAPGIEELRHAHSNRDPNFYQHKYANANLHPHQHPNAIANSYSDVHPNNHTYTDAYSDAHGHGDAHGHTDTHTYNWRVRIMLEVVHLFQLRRLFMDLAQVNQGAGQAWPAP